MEHDKYGYVIAMSPNAARKFFGQSKKAEVIDTGPPRDADKYKAGARKYAVRLSCQKLDKNAWKS